MTKLLRCSIKNNVYIYCRYSLIKVLNEVEIKRKNKIEVLFPAKVLEIKGNKTYPPSRPWGGTFLFKALLYACLPSQDAGSSPPGRGDPNRKLHLPL